MNRKEARIRYEAGCEAYVYLFARKQFFEFDGWVGDIVGGSAMFDGYYVFSMVDIVWDMNSNQPKGRIMEWIESDEALGHGMNYYSYTKGLMSEDLRQRL